MLLSPWIDSFKRRLSFPDRSRRTTAARRSRRKRSPSFAQVEKLEDRTLLSAVYSSDPSPDLAIPDNGQLTDTILVGDSTTIGDVNVTVDITHFSDHDLDVYLISPNNTRVELFTDVGGGGDNFSGTGLDDEAGTSITAGSAPFTGTFRPEGSMSAFDGETVNGTWTLEVNDDKRGKTGTLNSWSIEVSPQVPPTFSFPDFSDSTGLELVGDAAIANGNVLRLTPAAGGMEGSAWYTTEKQFASVDWETTFDFNLNENFDSPGGSDGFVFIVQNHAATYLAGGGGTLGYNNLPNSLAVEFDTFQNSEVSDPNQSHISVHTNGTGPNGWSESLSLGSYNTPSIMDDATTHSVKITYTPGTLSVFFDDMTSPVLTVAVDLSETLDLDSGRAWVGFTATTGGGWQNHDILNWEYRVLADTTTTLEVGNPQVIEGDAGTTNLEFTVTRLGDTTGVTTVNWATSDGTATTADNDYQSDSSQVSFAVGETQQTITVLVNGDATEEAHETMTVTLSAATGGTIVDAKGTGTILNDETSLSIGDATVIEGDESIRFIDDFIAAGSGGLDGANAMVFGPDGHLYVASQVTNNILRYEAATGAALPSAGNSGAVFVVSGSGGLDRPIGIAFGPDGHLYVPSRITHSVLRYDGTTGAFIDAFVPTGSGDLQNPRGMIFAGGKLYVTSVDSDDASQGTGDAVLRYDASTGAFLDTFVAPGSGGLDNPSRLAFGADGNLYVSSTSSNTNSILRYDSSGNFIDAFVSSGSGGLDGPVDVVFGGDGLLYVTSARSDEVLRYDSVSGAFVDAAVSSGSGGLDAPIDLLFDADGNMLVSSRNTDEILRYGAASQAVFTVSLSSPILETVTVNFSTADGTARVVDGDYVAASGTIVFDAGVMSRSIVVATLDDAALESVETFVVNLSNPSANSTIADAQGEATIIDDEGATITALSDSPDPVKQGQTLTLTATVIGAPESLSFYRDSNGNSTLEVGTDTLLGTDSNGGDGWSVSVGIPGNFAIGTYTYFAQGTFNGGASLTNVATTTGEVVKKGGKPNLLAETVGNGENVTLLTQSDAEAFAAYALQLWTDATGVTATAPLHVTVADLDGNLLGTTHGNTITLDVDAAGIGWFIDTTPGDAVEFDPALGNAAVPGRYDLLTAAAHEVGHVLGYQHTEGDGVMAETLSVDTRRLPVESEEATPTSTLADVDPVFLFETNDPVKNENDAEPTIVPVLQPVATTDDGLIEDTPTVETVDSTSDLVFLPDDEEDVNFDTLFADFDGSLADELLAV